MRNVSAVPNNAGKKPPDMQWDPKPLPPHPDLEKVVPFDPDTMLPKCIRRWVKGISDGKSTSIDYVATTVIPAFGATIGTRCVIRPENDDFTVGTTNYVLIVGLSSQMKTAAMDAAIGPFVTLSKWVDAETELDRIKWEDDEILLKQKRERINYKISSLNKKLAAEKNEEEKQSIRSEIKKLNKAFKKLRPCPFEEKALIINDVTPAAFKDHCLYNPNGITMHCDEVRNIFNRFIDDRTLLIEAHSGRKTNYKVGRKGTGNITIPKLCLSIFGGIQPGPASELVKDALNNGPNSDGLLQRFQFMVYPDKINEAVRTPGYDIKDHKDITELFERVYKFKFDLTGDNEDVDHHQGTKTLIFSTEAQEIYYRYKAILIKTCRDQTNEAIASHLSKYKSLFPSIALTLHIIAVAAGDSEPGPVSAEAAHMAWLWCDYLELHALRIYGMGAVGKNNSAIALWDALKQGRVNIDQEGIISRRELARQNILGIKTTNEIMMAIGLLRETDHLRWEEVAVSGGKQIIITVNPFYRDREHRNKQYLKNL